LPRNIGHSTDIAGGKMRRLTLVGVLLVALGALAASKETGSTILKDVQPAGTKQKKHKQQYDLMFTSSTGTDYTCRTSEKDNVKATDLPVGSGATYEVKDTKGKITTTAGKSYKCTIVRVAKNGIVTSQ
jgi:hypothetical protein